MLPLHSAVASCRAGGPDKALRRHRSRHAFCSFSRSEATGGLLTPAAGVAQGDGIEEASTRADLGGSARPPRPRGVLPGTGGKQPFNCLDGAGREAALPGSNVSGAKGFSEKEFRTCGNGLPFPPASAAGPEEGGRCSERCLPPRAPRVDGGGRSCGVDEAQGRAFVPAAPSGQVLYARLEWRYCVARRAYRCVPCRREGRPPGCRVAHAFSKIRYLALLGRS